MAHIGIRLGAAVISLGFLLASSSLQAQSSNPVPVKMNVLLIMDSSASMWAEVGGRPKYEATRDVLSGVIKNLPADTKFGMLAYGHRRTNDCSDIELVAPIGTKTAQEITDIATSFRPKGTTPLSDALRQAAEAFKGVDTAKMIVLITDGAEECSGDPCEVARQLALNGMVVKVNVVGLSLSAKEREQLQCIAKEGGGRFFDVTDKKTMFKAVDDINKEVVFFSRDRAPEVATPTPTPEPERVNLLLSSEGGKIAKTDNGRFESTITGQDGMYAWVRSGEEVVFSFADGKPATFSRFAIEVPERAPQNIKAFELYVSNKSPDGPFQLIDRFTADNAVKKSIYQEFKFTQVTAKYLKFKAISNHGAPMESWGDTQIYQLRVMGEK